MENPPAVESVASAVGSWPFKRRKFNRKRGEEISTINDNDTKAEEEASDSTQTPTVDELVSNYGSLQSADAEQDQHRTLSAAELFLQRKMHRRRLGVKFNNSDVDRISSAPQESSVTAPQGDAPEMKTLNDRFTPQTGQVADVDKHM